MTDKTNSNQRGLVGFLVTWAVLTACAKALGADLFPAVLAMVVVTGMIYRH